MSNNSSLVIYCEHQSARFNYIAKFIFEEVLGLSLEISTDLNSFEKSNAFKLNYSQSQVPNADLHIKPYGLLNESTIQEQQIEMGLWREIPCFFLQESSDIPFDIFSAAFYLISRYEEYLPYEADIYHRFPHEKSLAFREGFLQIPLLDLWIYELKACMKSKMPALQFKQMQAKLIPTYDIDIAYSYLGKGLIRNIGGAFRDLIFGRWGISKERLTVLFTKQQDPFDSYEFLDTLHEKYQLKPIYFMLLGKGSKYDKNLSPTSTCMQKLIIDLKQKYTIGIHPSFKSHDDIEILKEEINSLGSMLSRQHYIRFTLPSTFRNLLSCGIRNDYSMGYGSINGFRASTSFTHSWFDLEQNKVTNLNLHPFCFMECNSFFEQHYSATQALDEMLHYHTQIKKVGGNYIMIWHNFSLGKDTLWAGWKEVYTSFLEKVLIEKK